MNKHKTPPGTCATMDYKGNHCPEEVKHTLDDVELCANCYRTQSLMILKEGVYSLQSAIIEAHNQEIRELLKYPIINKE